MASLTYLDISNLTYSPVVRISNVPVLTSDGIVPLPNVVAANTGLISK